MAILGIDEVGRGPLAGPLVVGAVVLPDNKPEWVNELRDSKKLSAKKRENLNEIILSEIPGTGLGWVSSVEVDELGISEALKLATRRAVETVQRLRVSFNQIVIDGKVNFLAGTKLEKYVSTTVKADDLIKEVSAASIIAKVARDSYMVQLAEKYPQYGFEKHVGYGTKMHREAIVKYGVCPEHRLSFEPCKSLVGFERDNSMVNVVKNTTSVGSRGEEAVVEYLVRLGHKIVARNYKTKTYEIDMISVDGDKMYFTEVKYRKNDFAGGGLMAIDKDKITRMEFGAEDYIYRNPQYAKFDPILAVASVTDEFVVDDWFSLI